MASKQHKTGIWAECQVEQKKGVEGEGEAGVEEVVGREQEAEGKVERKIRRRRRSGR